MLLFARCMGGDENSPVKDGNLAKKRLQEARKHLADRGGQDLAPILDDSRLELDTDGEWCFRCLCNKAKSGKTSKGVLKLRRARTISDHLLSKSKDHINHLEGALGSVGLPLIVLCSLIILLSESKPATSEGTMERGKRPDLEPRLPAVPQSAPRPKPTMASRGNFAATSTENFQEYLNSEHSEKFEAETSSQCKCKFCVPEHRFFTTSTGDFAENLRRHLDSDLHNKWETAQVRQSTLPKALFSKGTAPVVDNAAKFINVRIHICPGYHSRKLTYFSRKYKTKRTVDPMILIYDALPLPIVREHDDETTDGNVDRTGPSPEWIPHVHGHDELHDFPHFTARKCRGTWIETTTSLQRREPEVVWETCAECCQVPFMPSFRKRIVRAYERIERGGPPRGTRVGPDSANHPTLRELYDNFPIIVKAYRRERQRRVYYQSVSHKLRERLAHYECGGPEVRICSGWFSPKR